MTSTLQALSLVGKAGRSKFTSQLHLRDRRSVWMQDGCKVYMDSYMASNGSRFMVTWAIFKNRLLGVGLTQNQETMTLRTFTTVDLFYMKTRVHRNSLKVAFGWGPGHMWLAHYTWGSVTTLHHDFGGVLERSFDTSFWGPHNSMVTALESSVKWPFVYIVKVIWDGTGHKPISRVVYHAVMTVSCRDRPLRHDTIGSM